MGSADVESGSTIYRSSNQTQTAPMARQPVARIPEKKKSIPGPTGFGFGSGQSPTFAATMIMTSGAAPYGSRADPCRRRSWLPGSSSIGVNARSIRGSGISQMSATIT